MDVFHGYGRISVSGVFVCVAAPNDYSADRALITCVDYLRHCQATDMEPGFFSRFIVHSEQAQHAADVKEIGACRRITQYVFERCRLSWLSVAG